MKRNLLSVLTFIGILAGSLVAMADEPATKEPSAKEPSTKEPSIAEQAKAAMAKHRSLSYELPNRPPFQTAEGIAKLELTQEQSAAIRDIGLVLNGKLLDQRQAAWEHERKAADLKGEEKDKFLLEHFKAEGPRAEERRKWALEARRLVEKLLTEKQLKLLRELEFEQRTKYLSYQPQIFEQLKLEKEQQEKIQAVQQAAQKRQRELMAEIGKLQSDTSAKMIQLLTPEQREELRALLQKMYDDSLQVR
jgi:hypothetical protein